MTLLRVGRIHGHPGADTVDIADGRIVRIGRNLAAASDCLDRSDTVLLPGLRDSHMHPVGIAANRRRLDVSDVGTVDELIDRISARAAQTSGAVIAVGFDDERVADGRMPSADELDRASADRVVVVYRHCSHIASANHFALGQAGIDAHTPDPLGGRIRHGADGALTGVLEENALVPLARALDQTVEAPDPASVHAVLSDLARLGLMAIDAMITTGDSMWCAGSSELEVLASLGAVSPVTIDVFVICTDPHDLRMAAERLDAAGQQIRFAGWKGFADGSLGARTAALRSPYEDAPSTSGMLVAKNLQLMAEAALHLGGQAAIHAIGDLAVEEAIRVAERIAVPGAVRIEHASVADPDQVDRMATTGVVASVQPSFVASDGPWLTRRLGPDRARWAYPFASMLRSGVRLRGGSDAPIESADPLVGISDACADRRTGSSVEQGLTVDQAIDLYAIGPIEVGGSASFVLCKGEPDDPASSVVEVWKNGAPV